MARAATYYEATAHAAPVTLPLNGDAQADVCIVGGGYTGLSAALSLARAGRSVILLDAAEIGQGASGRNGGQVHVGFRRDQQWLEAHLGMETARAIWQLSLDAQDYLLSLMREHGIACDWQPGLLHLDHRARFVAHSHAYAQHVRGTYGYDGMTPVDRDEARHLVASAAYHGGVRYRDGGHLHALNFALGLARAAQKAGAALHPRTSVRQIVRQGRQWCARTAQGSIHAETLILACNGLLDGLMPDLEARVMPINNYIATTAPLADPESVIRHQLAVADSRFVVHYFRMTPDGRLLFGGGETYSRNIAPDIGILVRRHLRRIFPQLADATLEYAWGGTLAVTPSRLPFVRRLQPGLYTSAGYSGQGVMFAPYFGKLLADVICHESAQFDLLSRLPVPRFPGGTWLRAPILVSAMLALRLRDML